MSTALVPEVCWAEACPTLLVPEIRLAEEEHVLHPHALVFLLLPHLGHLQVVFENESGFASFPLLTFALKARMTKIAIKSWARYLPAYWGTYTCQSHYKILVIAK